MRIVNLDTFLAIKGEVLFAKYEPVIFNDLCIRSAGGAYSNKDFVCQEIIQVEGDDGNEVINKLFRSAEQGESFKLDLDCMGRDGLFNPDQLFLVWEKEDVKALIARLTTTLNTMED